MDQGGENQANEPHPSGSERVENYRTEDFEVNVRIYAQDHSSSTL